MKRLPCPDANEAPSGRLCVGLPDRRREWFLSDKTTIWEALVPLDGIACRHDPVCSACRGTARNQFARIRWWLSSSAERARHRFTRLSPARRRAYAERTAHAWPGARAE